MKCEHGLVGPRSGEHSITALGHAASRDPVAQDAS